LGNWVILLKKLCFLFDKALKTFELKIFRSTVNFFIKQNEGIGHQ